ncbi:hypothetical protein EDB80DRAFT_162540 [Ilyonectria destructans]|nr:hypothetical protein EDB80DRAFT_162540 [Ilyonectria destructans]
MRRPSYSPASGFWPMLLGYLIHQPVVRISRRVIATKWRPQLVGYTQHPDCSIVQAESRFTTASRASFPALLSTTAILCRQPCTDRQTREATTNRDWFCSTVVPKRCSWGLLAVTTEHQLFVCLAQTSRTISWQLIAFQLCPPPLLSSIPIPLTIFSSPVQRGSPYEGKERRTSGSLREENKVPLTEGTAVWHNREAIMSSLEGMYLLCQTCHTSTFLGDYIR